MDQAPPSYSTSAPPPAGTRVPATTSAPFPSSHLTGPAPFFDTSSSHTYPIFVGPSLSIPRRGIPELTGSSVGVDGDQERAALQGFTGFAAASEGSVWRG